MRQVQCSLCRALDCEGYRRCTALIAPPHRGVGRLDMPGEPRRIEQRVCLAILRQFRGDDGEERTIACKPGANASYSSSDVVISSGSPMARNTLAATRPAKVS